jgi:ribosomal protein S12 methylthiotransferase accessory factor
VNEASSSAFAYTLGTTRVRPPRETVEQLTPLMPVFGITRIANVTGLDSIGIPVVMVTRPNARSVSVSQGKGVDLDAAKASGLMEAIEIHHAEHILKPLLLCSLNELRFRAPVADVAALALSSRGEFTATSRILWTEGTDWVTGEPLWVPYELVHTDFRYPFPSGSGHFLCTSNGLASGNTIDEAVCHGLCEVVERDAVARWLVRAPQDQADTELDLTTVTDPVCRALLAKFAAAGARVRVWNVTTDIGVPAFHAWVEAPRTGQPLAVSGFKGHGCHPFAGIALSRALTEAAQGRLTMIAGVRDDIDPGAYDPKDDPSPPEEPTTTPSGDYRSVASLDGSSPRALVEVITRRLAAIGLARVVVVDLTRPEFEIPVARVIVPGLEGAPFARRYRPGPRALQAAGVAP